MFGRRKGVSPILATVLVVLVVISLSGAFLVFTQRTTTSLTESGQESQERLQAELDVRPVIESVSGDSVFLRNAGNDPIEEGSVSFFLEDALVDHSLSSPIQPNEVGEVILSNGYRAGSGRMSLRVSAGALSDSVSVDLEPDSPILCPDGLTVIDVSEVDSATVDVSGMSNFCIFKFEASRSDATSSSEGSSGVAASQEGVVPWTQVTQDGARTACENAGYELASNRQWQAATAAVIGDSASFVHGNNDFGKAVEDGSETCVDDPTRSGTNRCLTGTGPDTWSTARGVADLNGNVWEWTDDFYGDGSVCDSDSFDDDGDTADGHVNEWNSQEACPSEIDGANSDFGDDHYWEADDGTSDGAVLRGGTWGLGARAGSWALLLNDPPSASSPHIGFRCSLG